MDSFPKKGHYIRLHPGHRNKLLLVPQGGTPPQTPSGSQRTQMPSPCWWGPHTKPHHPLSNLILGTEGVFALTPRGHLHPIPHPIPKGPPCLVPTGEIPPLFPLPPFKPHPSLRGPPCLNLKDEIPLQTPSSSLKSHLHHRGPTMPCPHEGTPPKWHRGLLCLVPTVPSPQPNA